MSKKEKVKEERTEDNKKETKIKKKKLNSVFQFFVNLVPRFLFIFLDFI